MSGQGPPRPLRPFVPRTLQDTLTAGPIAEESKIRRASTACIECQRCQTKVPFPFEARASFGILWCYCMVRQFEPTKIIVVASAAIHSSPSFYNTPFWHPAFPTPLKYSAQSTGLPCSECALHGRDYIINKTADKHHKVARDCLKQKLVYYHRFFEELFKAIRHGNHEDINHIINVIQSGVLEKEICLVIAQFSWFGDKAFNGGLLDWQNHTAGQWGLRLMMSH
jgi:hypothetical protein